MTVVVERGWLGGITGPGPDDVGVWVMEGATAPHLMLASRSGEDWFSAGDPAGWSQRGVGGRRGEGEGPRRSHQRRYRSQRPLGQGITPDRDDRVLPLTRTPLKEGMRVRYDAIAYRTRDVRVPIPYTTSTSYSDTMSAGTVRLARAGVDGLLVERTWITFVNGEAVATEVLSRTVLQEAIAALRVVGREKQTDGEDESDGTQVGEASWYSFAPGGGLTAAHPWLPFGTVVTVTNIANGNTVQVVINDRGPSADGSSTSPTRRSPGSPRSPKASVRSGSAGERGDGLGRSQLKDLAARHGIRPTRIRGQHFLADPNLARAIVADAGVREGDRVVEVGAGLGSLTVPLAEAGARVLAIEVDHGLSRALREVVGSYPNVRIEVSDAMRTDWTTALSADRWSMVSNLPYNVSVPLLVEFLQSAPIDRYVVMVQREVGERLVARPGEEAYGAVSVRVAYRADARVLRRVPAAVFWPRPRVDSVLVRLDPPAARRRRGSGGAVRDRRRGVRRAAQDDGERAPTPRPRRRGRRRDPASGRPGPERPRRAARAGRVRRDRADDARTGVEAVTARTIRRDAHAKINLFLRVLSIREDGYHEIESLVVPISLADRVVVRPAEDLHVEIAGEPAFSPGGLNLALVAALALADACADAAGALVEIDKRIPVAGGLGGGSADAAATLLALNELWGCEVDAATLEQIGERIGSDVPAMLSRRGRPGGWAG